MSNPPPESDRAEVVELLRQQFKAGPDAVDTMSPQDRELMASATENEKWAAARLALQDIARTGNCVEMGDGTRGDLPDDPEWAC